MGRAFNVCALSQGWRHSLDQDGEHGNDIIPNGKWFVGLEGRFNCVATQLVSANNMHLFIG
jgi:hypothetical protein